MSLTYPLDMTIHGEALVGSVASAARDARLDTNRAYTLHHTGKIVSASDIPTDDDYPIFVQFRALKDNYDITADFSDEDDKIILQSGETCVVPIGVPYVAWKSGASEAAECALQIVAGPPRTA
jgi:hypothetical protein